MKICGCSSLFDGKKIYHDRKGYSIVWMDRKNKKCHILVWEHFNGPKPDGFDVHHKDEDKSNFCIENLELLSASDHQKLHAGWIKERGEWSKKPCTNCKKTLPLIDFYKRKGFTPTAKCKACHIVDTNKWASKNADKVRAIKLKSYHKRKALK